MQYSVRAPGPLHIVGGGREVSSTTTTTVQAEISIGVWSESADWARKLFRADCRPSPDAMLANDLVKPGSDWIGRHACSLFM
jgi:hypothetical protein